LRELSGRIAHLIRWALGNRMPDLDRFLFKLLVIRCQAGDRFAFAELVSLCQPRLRAFLGKMLNDPHQADDIAQDVWMDVFRDLKRLTDPSAFLPWMYRIGRNRVFRMLRRPQLPTVSTDTTDAMAQAADEPEFTPEDARAVHAALDQLIPEHREVLLLRFIEDMSYDDIAAVVGCPVGTVRSRIHNAKHNLRRIIEPTTNQRSGL
jgi:RNA polymerase sigma-70 factor (ECF subfamily)